MGGKPKTRSRREILNWLKSKGPQDAGTLASRIGISAMAVRQHLYELARDELVEYELAPGVRGRPAKLWKLTAAADRHFPDGHSELTVDLLSSLRETFGETGMARLLAGRTERQVEAYRAEMPGRGSLARRLETLARIRTGEGYMAEVVAERDGAFLLIENHCPVCDAARVCTGLCSGELDVFRKVLGPRVEVEREEHILDGSRRCAYRVRRGPAP
jgi:predicted ArsR family transcriptional regulator